MFRTVAVRAGRSPRPSGQEEGPRDPVPPLARELPGEGRELLLAIEMEPEGGDLTHEVMVGIPLEVGEFEA